MISVCNEGQIYFDIAHDAKETGFYYCNDNKWIPMQKSSVCGSISVTSLRTEVIKDKDIYNHVAVIYILILVLVVLIFGKRETLNDCNRR